MNQYQHLIMIGPQGSGKGTQAQHLVERYGYEDIATGQMLREHVAAKDQLGRDVARFLQHGELVPDQIIEEIVRKRLGNLAPDQPVVFDGFPRTVKQAHILERLLIARGQAQPTAIYLHVSRALVIQRLAHRYVCAECGKILQFASGVLHRCPFCGGQVEVRTDDRPEAIETRLNLFFEQTLPVIDYYKKLRHLIEIDASGSIDEVTLLIEHALELGNNHVDAAQNT